MSSKALPGPGGFVLLPVVMALVLIAAVAFWINHETSISIEVQANRFEKEKTCYLLEAVFNLAKWRVNQAAITGDACSGYDTVNGAGSLLGSNYTVSVSETSGSPVTI